jgi:hypothetical protein
VFLYREKKSGLVPYIFPKIGKMVGNLLLVLLGSASSIIILAVVMMMMMMRRGLHLWQRMTEFCLFYCVLLSFCLRHLMLLSFIKTL